MNYNPLAAAAFTLLVLASCGQQTDPAVSSSPEEIAAALRGVTAAGVRSHIEVLAADDMEGREAGTAAYRRAADYVASRFADTRLAPMGEGGSYFQEVPVHVTRLIGDSASLTLQRGDAYEDLAFGTDFVSAGSFGASADSVTAPLVFVGFGIRALDYDHDDFAAVNVAGKILVLLSGAPPYFATDQRAFYSSATGKRALAASLGAVGIFTIRTPVDQERLPWPSVVASTASARMRWIDAVGAPHEGFPELVGDSMISEAGAERLFALAGQDLPALFKRHSAGQTGSFELGVAATISGGSEQQRDSSPNVIGVVSGSDAGLRDEYILYTAHLDHLGIRPELPGDSVHNGAYDNAAGVAVLLEVAKIIARMAHGPRRSIIFAAVTGEEKGLVGSDYLANHPPVPIRQIVANINIDMPFLGFPVADIEGLGASHSTLQGALQRATAQLGMALTPDPRPELVRLIRSDQFSFVKQGIPGLNFKAGSISSDPSIDGAAMLQEYLHKHYHQPSDDLSLPYNSEGAERFAKSALLFGLIVANDDEPPRWNDGDFFGTRFGHRGQLPDAQAAARQAIGSHLSRVSGKSGKCQFAGTVQRREDTMQGWRPGPKHRGPCDNAGQGNYRGSSVMTHDSVRRRQGRIAQ